MRFDLWFHAFEVNMGVRYGQTASCCVASTCGAACRAEQHAPTGGTAAAGFDQDQHRKNHRLPQGS